MHLRLAGSDLELTGRPLLMGVLNATPDSFSDAGLYTTLEQRTERAADLLEQGAGIIDIGGQSGITGVPEIPAEEEIERVVPLIERVAGGLKALVSVDTYKPEVAEAAIAAGARIVNDTSGLREPAVADICARTGTGLVLMHNRSAPKVRLTDPDLYGDAGPVPDVLDFLSEKLAEAIARGVDREATVLDPGPDFSKTPAQTVEVLRRLDEIGALGRPLLLAVSRKDFIGAITGRPPRERGAGTLAALAHLAFRTPSIVRLHDVHDARDFLDVLEVLRGDRELDAEALLAQELRREPSQRS